MKKLMLTLSAIAMGFAVSAATVDWKYSVTGGGTTGGELAGYNAYLVNGSAWDAAVLAGITADTLKDASIALDKTTFNAGTGKGSKSYSTTSDGVTSGTRAVEVTSINVGDNLSVYYVFVDPDSKNYLAVADTIVGRASDGAELLGSNTTTTFANFTTATNWKPFGGTEPTPEPTSGLLLLLGTAGLAIKRKRA